MNPPNQQYVISIMSRDRVGIVAEVSQVIAEIEGDIADIRQTVLRGYFSMILFATFPETVSADIIRRQLAKVSEASDFPLEFTMRQPRPGLPTEHTIDADNSYVLTVSGKDRIGFVAAVSAFCVAHQLNILDLSTTVAGGDYIMILLIDLSRCPDYDVLHRQMADFGRETGLNLVLQHHDIFKATNEISRL